MAIQRTAMGRSVDMASLATQNEKTRAVGNMGVNARGDVLDNQNRIVKDNTARVKAHYDNTIGTTQRPQVDTGMSFGQDILPRPAVEHIEMTEEEKRMDAEFNDDGDLPQ